MVREPNIPLFLWIATAILLHLTSGGGVTKISEAVQEQMDVRRFARSVSSQVRRAHSGIEISLEEGLEPPPPEVAPDPSQTQQEPEHASDTPISEAQKPEEQLEPQEPKPEEQKQAEKEKKIKVVEVQPQPPREQADPQEIQRRIAVQQLVEDENQKPNPDAEFIGEHDNHVSEQSQARITSTEQNDGKPQPGGEYSGPTSEPGDSHVNDIAQLEDRDGTPDRAPGNRDNGERDLSSAPEMAQFGSREAQAARTQGQTQSQPDRQTQGLARVQRPNDPGQAEQKASPGTQENPEVNSSPSGQYAALDSASAQPAQREQKQRPKHLPPPRGQQQTQALLGLGASGTTQGGINLNLTHQDALATVGQDQLAKQILADGERRRSKHRGSWHTSGLERWRSAIENYVPHVKPGNQTALNTARVPFALYLNKIHLRLHPIFADQFLAHLDGLPASNPLNRYEMHTNLEIVINRNDGSIVDMGITKASGVTAFDIGALDSVARAAPFGTPPSSIVSPDGNVYLHWEFWRNPMYACSTYFARPKMLRAEPRSAPVEPPFPAPLRPEEEPVPTQGRQGSLLPGLPAPSDSPGDNRLAHLW